MKTVKMDYGDGLISVDLPDSATWDDVMYRIYVRQAVDAGIKDSDEGRTIDVNEVRKRFGLPA